MTENVKYGILFKGKLLKFHFYWFEDSHVCTLDDELGMVWLVDSEEIANEVARPGGSPYSDDHFKPYNPYSDDDCKVVKVNIQIIPGE